MTNNNSQHNNQRNQQEKQQQLAQQLFCTNAAYTSLTKTSRIAKKVDSYPVESYPVIFNDIVQWVKGNNQPDFIERTPLLIKKINADLSLRRVYLQLVKQLKFAESGLQAAASSGTLLPERVTEQFSLKFKRDQHFPNQVYAILTIHHPKESHLNHAIALHITTPTEAQCLYFPILMDGRSQLLMEEDEHHFSLLIDGNSHLYLI